MKFKEFVVNSLPRVRSRKKKAQQPKTLNNELLYDKNRNRFGPKLTWEKAFGVVSPDCDQYQPKQDGVCYYSLEEAVKTACGQIIDTFRYQDTNSFTDRPNASHQFGIDLLQRHNFLTFGSEEHVDCNTVPKSRSKIRTNPWIPSPKSSSTSSSESCSNCSSTSTSPALTPSNKNNNYSSKSSLTLSGLNSQLPRNQMVSNNLQNRCACSSDVRHPVYVRYPSERTIRELNNLNCGSTPACDTDGSSDLSPSMEICSRGNSFVVENISFEYEESLESTLEKTLVKRDVSIDDLLAEDEELRDAAVQTDFTDDDVDSDWPHNDDVMPEMTEFPRCADCMQDSTDTGYSSLGRDGQFETDDDFRYYKVIETCTGGQSSLDISSDGSVFSAVVPEDTQINVCYPELALPTASDYGSVCAEQCSLSLKEGNTDVTEQMSSEGNVEHMNNVDDITQAPFDPSVERRELDDVMTDAPSVRSFRQVNSSLTVKVGDVDKTPSMPRNNFDDVTTASSGRTLRQVKSSLEEKVTRLRLEKQIVERKIRAAQEEDRLVEEQRSRFQHLLTFHKKEILLTTLRHLADRLDEQGHRLQASYAVILTMQQKFAKQQADLGPFTHAAM